MEVIQVIISTNTIRVGPVWIEHYPKEATDSLSETFELAVFSSHGAIERAPYLRERSLTIGEPTAVPNAMGTAIRAPSRQSTRPHGRNGWSPQPQRDDA
jgi:hypothetical protein